VYRVQLVPHDLHAAAPAQRPAQLGLPIGWRAAVRGLWYGRHA
jgi:hypothetical protein